MAGYESLLLPVIRRISDRLERTTIASEVADYLGLGRGMVLAEFRKMPGDRNRAAAPAQPQRDAVPVRERVLLRSLVENPEAREALLPGLPRFAVVRAFFNLASD